MKSSARAVGNISVIVVVALWAASHENDVHCLLIWETVRHVLVRSFLVTRALLVRGVCPAELVAGVKGAIDRIGC